LAAALAQIDLPRPAASVFMAAFDIIIGRA
jgi:hypothetical protein